MIIEMDEVLYEFSKVYREMFLSKYSDVELSEDIAAIAMAHTLEVKGDAVQNISCSGNVTWKATQRFLDRTGLEAGSLVKIHTQANPTWLGRPRRRLS